MAASKIEKAILADDADALETMIAGMESQVQMRLKRAPNVVLSLSAEALLGLGWLLPRVEHTLQRHQLLDARSLELLGRWQEVATSQRSAVDPGAVAARSLPADAVVRMLVAIPLTMSAHGGICSKAIRRNVAAFAKECLGILELKEPATYPSIHRRGRWAFVMDACDLLATSLTLLAMIGFVLYAVHWPDVEVPPVSTARAAALPTAQVAASL